MDDGAQIETDWDLAAQPAPAYEAHQRVSWWEVETATLIRCGVAQRMQSSKGLSWDWWLTKRLILACGWLKGLSVQQQFSHLLEWLRLEDKKSSRIQFPFKADSSD